MTKFFKKAELRFNGRTSSSIRAPSYPCISLSLFSLPTPSSLTSFLISHRNFTPINVLHTWFHIGIFFLESCIVILAWPKKSDCMWDGAQGLAHSLPRCQEELHPMWMWGMESLLLGDRPMAKTFNQYWSGKKPWWMGMTLMVRWFRHIKTVARTLLQCLRDF